MGDVRHVVAQEGSPFLAWRPASLDHVLGNTRLRDAKAKLEQCAVDAGRAPNGLSTLIRRINPRSSVSIGGRPRNGNDFQRQ